MGTSRLIPSWPSGLHAAVDARSRAPLVISVQQADGNTIVTATEVQTLTGVLTGTRVASGT